MKNNALLQEEVLGSDQILQVTALLYLKEALVNQQFESCPEIIDSAKKFGVSQEDVSAVIKDYLNPARIAPSRLKKEV